MSFLIEMGPNLGPRLLHLAYEDARLFQRGVQSQLRLWIAIGLRQNPEFLDPIVRPDGWATYTLRLPTEEVDWVEQVARNITLPLTLSRFASAIRKKGKVSATCRSLAYLGRETLKLYPALDPLYRSDKALNRATYHKLRTHDLRPFPGFSRRGCRDLWSDDIYRGYNAVVKQHMNYLVAPDYAPPLR